MTLVAIDLGVRARQGESCLLVMHEREGRRHERVPLMTRQTISTPKRAQPKLSLMGIAVTGTTVVGMPARIRLTETNKLRLLLAESGVTGATGEFVVRGFQREAGTRMQARIERRQRANKRLMNRRMTVLARVIHG